MATTLALKGTAEELKEFALPAIKDISLVGFGAFLGNFATKYFPEKAAASGLVKGLLELGLGVLGLYFATKKNSGAAAKIMLGVGADGAMKVLEEIIP